MTILVTFSTCVVPFQLFKTFMFHLSLQILFQYSLISQSLIALIPADLVFWKLNLTIVIYSALWSLSALQIPQHHKLFTIIILTSFCLYPSLLSAKLLKPCHFCMSSGPSKWLFILLLCLFFPAPHTVSWLCLLPPKVNLLSESFENQLAAGLSFTVVNL